MDNREENAALVERLRLLMSGDTQIVKTDFARNTLEQAISALSRSQDAFQARVHPWMLACFGAAIAADCQERNHRFFEEAAELVQSCGMTASEAHQLVEYTWSRPVGEKSQEVGGVMVTLAALCLANGLDMHAAGETELERISAPETMAKIRAKQAAKPKHSPLPEARSQDVARVAKLRIGTRIRFVATLSESATGDHPDLLYANNGETGEITGHNDFEGYMVKTDSWPHSFGAQREEFEVDTSVTRTAAPQPPQAGASSDAIELLRKFMEYRDSDCVPNVLFDCARTIIDLATSAPEGCTPADAKMLRAANHQLASENDRLRELLRPFAHLASSSLSWAAVQYCIADDPKHQTFQASQMHRAFNRAADALRENFPAGASNVSIQVDPTAPPLTLKDADPAAPAVAPLDYDGVVSICDAHGIGLPVDCVEMVVEIIRHAAPAPAEPKGERQAAHEPDRCTKCGVHPDSLVVSCVAAECPVFGHKKPERRAPTLSDEQIEAVWDSTALRDDRVLAFGRAIVVAVKGGNNE